MSSTGFFVRGPSGEIAGLAVRYADRAGFVFHASCATFAHLDGSVFATLDAAQRAARSLPRAAPVQTSASHIAA